MTGGEIAQIITAIGALIAPIASVLAVIVSVRTGRRVEEVHVATNGLTKQLVAATAVASESKGRDEERSRERRA